MSFMFCLRNLHLIQCQTQNKILYSRNLVVLTHILISDSFLVNFSIWCGLSVKVYYSVR